MRVLYVATLLATAVVAADGALPDAKRISGILGIGANDRLIFAYASADALFITVEHWPQDAPIRTLRSFKLLPAKKDSDILGAIDCQLDGHSQNGLVAEAKRSTTRSHLHIVR